MSRRVTSGAGGGGGTHSHSLASAGMFRSGSPSSSPRNVSGTGVLRNVSLDGMVECIRTVSVMHACMYGIWVSIWSASDGSSRASHSSRTFCRMWGSW